MIEIPGYTLLRQLGQGGMAAVFLAEQQSLGREVALKVLASNLTQDADARERFVREARTAAKLHHPHIVPIYDVGTHGDLAYIAMEFEPGGTARGDAKYSISRAPAPRAQAAAPTCRSMRRARPARRAC